MMIPSAVAKVAAFALCPLGNEPKSDVTSIASGRGRSTMFLIS